MKRQRVLELKIIEYTLPILLQVSLCTIFYPKFADDVFRSGRTVLQLKEESFELSIDVGGMGAFTVAKTIFGIW